MNPDLFDLESFEILHPDDREFLARFALLEPEKQERVIQKIDELIEKKKYQDK